LKLKYDEPLLNFAFKFNLRRYTGGVMFGAGWGLGGRGCLSPRHFSAHPEPVLGIDWSYI
jgi:hypothetical protein